MTPNVEEMRKRMEEIQQKNDAFLAAHVPGYDPEKAKAARDKLRELMQNGAAREKK